MGRFKATAEGNVPFTPEEEAEWDAMEAEWEANEPQRRREAMTIDLIDLEKIKPALDVERHCC